MERASARVSAAPWLDIRKEQSIDPKKIVKYPVPKRGDYVLINESYSKYKGYNHRFGHGLGGPRLKPERYIGTVSGEYSHLFTIDTPRGIRTETRNDFTIGLVRFLVLKELPPNISAISYDDMAIDKFADTFEELLISIREA